MPNHKPKCRSFLEKKLKECWYASPDSKGSGRLCGIDYCTSVEFGKNLQAHLKSLCDQLDSSSYKFSKLRFIPIPKPNEKYRIICIPTVRDRLVQRYLLQDIKERKNLKKVNNNISYGGGGAGKGPPGAIKRAVGLRNKNPWVLKTDISSFFDKIDRSYLIEALKKKIKNQRLLILLEQVINSEILVKNEKDKKTLHANGIQVGQGLRQGMPLSPLFSNIFLLSFDKAVIKKRFKIIRYVDDIIAFADSEKECHSIKDFIEKQLLKINLSIPSLADAKTKTEIIDPASSVCFLGMEIYPKNGRFFRKIPDASIRKILDNFEGYSSYPNLSKENENYSDVCIRLNNMLQAYRSIYKGSTNMGSFLSQLEDKIKEVKNKLLFDILGEKIFNFIKNTLSNDKKKFLGLLWG
jgi:RNA-directed DNA polymerase